MLILQIKIPCMKQMFLNKRDIKNKKLGSWFLDVMTLRNDYKA